MRALFCALMLLMPMSACTANKAKPPAKTQPDAAPKKKVGCSTDQDCQLLSFYCDGCKCLALGPQEADPVCTGKKVNCIADPCMNKAVACKASKCVIVEGQTQ